MPYIAKKLRKLVNARDDENLTGLHGAFSGGELNYQISVVVDEYVGRMGLNYGVIADVRAALIGCMSEFDRKIAWPYEDVKCQENGEVFHASLAAFAEKCHGNR